MLLSIAPYLLENVMSNKSWHAWDRLSGEIVGRHAMHMHENLVMPKINPNSIKDVTSTTKEADKFTLLLAHGKGEMSTTLSAKWNAIALVGGNCHIDYYSVDIIILIYVSRDWGDGFILRELNLQMRRRQYRVHEWLV